MTSYEELTPEEAHRREAEFHAIDVRAAHEYEGPLGHVRGARLIPLPKLGARASELPTDRSVLFVCRSGARSGTACEQFADLGLGQAINLAGGMIAWNRAQLPTVATDPGSLVELVEGVVRWLAQVGPHSHDETRELLRQRIQGIQGTGSSPDALSHAAVDEVLDDLEASFFPAGGPPDLDLSRISFRRSLAVL